MLPHSANPIALLTKTILSIRQSFLISSLLLTSGFCLTSNMAMAHDNEHILPPKLIDDLVETYCPIAATSVKESSALSYRCYEDTDANTEYVLDYSIDFIPLIFTDFNKDGNVDLALEIRSSGPLGGSAYTTSSIHYLLLDGEQQLIRDHQVLLYAPFSKHIVSYQVEDEQINYQAEPNFRASPEAYDDSGELLVAPLDFVVNWVGGAPISTEYQHNCQLAKATDKRIFTANIGVTRYRDIGMHDYLQEITEETQLNQFMISATMSGCDNRKVSFFIKPTTGQSLPVLADVVQQLIPISNYARQLNMLLRLDRQSQLRFNERIPLSDQWSALVRVERSSKVPSITIDLIEGE